MRSRCFCKCIFLISKSLQTKTIAWWLTNTLYADDLILLPKITGWIYLECPRWRSQRLAHIRLALNTSIPKPWGHAKPDCDSLFSWSCWLVITRINIWLHFDTNNVRNGWRMNIVCTHYVCGEKFTNKHTYTHTTTTWFFEAVITPTILCGLKTVPMWDGNSLEDESVQTTMRRTNARFDNANQNFPAEWHLAFKIFFVGRSHWITCWFSADINYCWPKKKENRPTCK